MLHELYERCVAFSDSFSVSDGPCCLDWRSLLQLLLYYLKDNRRDPLKGRLILIPYITLIYPLYSLIKPLYNSKGPFKGPSFSSLNYAALSCAAVLGFMFRRFGRLRVYGASDSSWINPLLVRASKGRV